MKRVQLTGLGRPEDVCRVAEVEDVGAPAANEVVVAIKAAAINPADLLIMEGRYPGPTSFPASLGIEGAGEVVAVGDSVSGLAVGDRVMSFGRENWVEQVRGDAALFIKLPPAISWQDAAQLKANPPSAHLMLKNYVDLEPGDWVVQNAANSAVGRHVIRLAKSRGFKTINVVRRDSLIAELEAIGADLVLVDGDDLGERARAAIGADAKVRLAIDAVGGASGSAEGEAGEQEHVLESGAGRDVNVEGEHSDEQDRLDDLAGHVRGTPQRDPDHEWKGMHDQRFDSQDLGKMVERAIVAPERHGVLHRQREQRSGGHQVFPPELHGLTALPKG